MVAMPVILCLIEIIGLGYFMVKYVKTSEIKWLIWATLWVSIG